MGSVRRRPVSDRYLMSIVRGMMDTAPRTMDRVARKIGSMRS
jgi:hypothetical protein